MHNPTVLAELVEAVELAEASFALEGERGTVTTGGHLVTSPAAHQLVHEPMPTGPLSPGVRACLAAWMHNTPFCTQRSS